ncbi:MAG: hypothetical protein IT379_18380, partial [Deltaproteobacteria bacterium]|nr:hypothetical protein [Deltaproteobacteria bacterium]
MKRQRPGRYESSASIAVLAMTSVCACTLSFDGPGEATGDVARRDAAGPDSAGLDARPSDLGGSDVGADVARACTSDGDCDDRLDCTLDACDSGRCTWTPDDSRCGIGGGGGPVTVCAAARCDPARGCVVGAAPVGTACDDGDACTSTSSCDAEGRCTGPSRCPDDGDPCTVSVCGTGGTCGVIDVEDGTACGASSQCCGGTCFDVATDAMHCGSCG